MKSNVAALAWVVDRSGRVQRLKLCGTWEEAGKLIDGWSEAGASEVMRIEGPAERMEEIERDFRAGLVERIKLK